jgi:hypothetical protein
MNDQEWLRLKGVEESQIEDVAERIAILMVDGDFSEHNARYTAHIEHLKRTRSKTQDTSIKTG